MDKYVEHVDDGEGLPRPARVVEFTIDLVNGADPQQARGWQLPAGPCREEAETQVSRLKFCKWTQFDPYRVLGLQVSWLSLKGRELRFCVDYRALNKLTVPLAYELPRIDVVLDNVGWVARCGSQL